MAENTIPNDPMILLSFVNTKLRDFYPSLDKMCDDLGCSKEETESKLSAIDYKYNAELNKFVWHQRNVRFIVQFIWYD